MCGYFSWVQLGVVEPQLLGGYQERYLTWVHDGEFPLNKKCFDAGNGVQLSVSVDSR